MLLPSPAASAHPSSAIFALSLTLGSAFEVSFTRLSHFLVKIYSEPHAAAVVIHLVNNPGEQVWAVSAFTHEHTKLKTFIIWFEPDDSVLLAAWKTTQSLSFLSLRR